MVDTETQKLIDSIDAFFNKKGINVESRFHITKLLSEQYWDDFINEGEEEDVDEGLDDDFETDEPEVQEDEEVLEDLEVPNSVPKLNLPPKNQPSALKKVKVKTLKPRLRE